jgi:TPR repeat protein
VHALLLSLAVAASPDAVKASCDAGKASDCVQLGRLYQNGRGLKKDMAAAAAAYKKACDLADASGCTSLGTMHNSGLGMRKDVARAEELFRQGCDGGDAPGCMSVGFAQAVKEDGALSLPAAVASFVRANDLATKACDAGQWYASADNVSGCFVLGSLNEAGWGVRKDVVRAAGFYERGCTAGDDHACAFAARLYRTGTGVAKDPARAATLLEHACDAEHGWGCEELGEVAKAYQSGSGVSKDVARGAALFVRACENGEGSACDDLGDLYASGKGVPKDSAKAAAAYKKACDHGFVYDLSPAALQTACDSGSGAACKQLAYRATMGERGVAKDEARAEKMNERACDAGIAEACWDRGSSYDWRSEESKARAQAFAARGVPLDEKACAAGEGEACYRLGTAYRVGTGVEKDPAKAAAFYKEACNRGSTEGCWQTFGR